MFKSTSAHPVRALIAVTLLGFQLWYLFNVGYTDSLNRSSWQEDSLFRGALLLLVVQGCSHLLIAIIAPAGAAGLFTKVSVLPLAPFVALFAGLTFIFPGSLITLRELLDNGNPIPALAYGAAALYLAAAYWAIEIADERAW